MDGRPNFESQAFSKLLAHEPKKYMVENQFMYEEEAFPNYPFLYTKSLAHPTNKYNAMQFHANFVVRNLLDPDCNKVELPFCVPYISIADDPGPIGKDA